MPLYVFSLYAYIYITITTMSQRQLKSRNFQRSNVDLCNIIILATISKIIFSNIYI